MANFKFFAKEKKNDMEELLEAREQYNKMNEYQLYDEINSLSKNKEVLQNETKSISKKMLMCILVSTMCTTLNTVAVGVVGFITLPVIIGAAAATVYYAVKSIRNRSEIKKNENKMNMATEIYTNKQNVRKAAELERTKSKENEKEPTLLQQRMRERAMEKQTEKQVSIAPAFERNSKSDMSQTL